jgi:lysophospholipase L1-like esterase
VILLTTDIDRQYTGNEPLAANGRRRTVINHTPYCLLVLSLITNSVVAVDAVHVAATDRAVSYVGRWGTIERSGRTSKATVNSSSQIYLTFSGQHVAGLFDVGEIDYLEQIYVRADRGPWALFTIDRSRIEFFRAGLSSGWHRLEIAVKDVDGRGDRVRGERWFPPLHSAVVFQGFELDSGAKIEPTPLSTRLPLLEFFGDSITQGEGLLQPGGAVTSSDGLATYAWIAGEELGTIHAQVAFGGQGVIRNASGEVPPAVLSFAWNFAGSPADFSRTPDFIVINEGTNDQPYPANEFIEAYLGFLREVRKHCPQTQIFALRPFHGDRFHGDDVAEAVRRMADPRILYVDTTGWLDENDYTDGAHPNAAGSRKAAARLVEYLKPYVTAWKSTHTASR